MSPKGRGFCQPAAKLPRLGTSRCGGVAFMREVPKSSRSLGPSCGWLALQGPAQRYARQEAASAIGQEKARYVLFYHGRNSQEPEAAAGR
jgi:hypothetical protein